MENPVIKGTIGIAVSMVIIVLALQHQLDIQKIEDDLEIRPVSVLKTPPEPKEKPKKSLFSSKPPPAVKSHSDTGLPNTSASFIKESSSWDLFVEALYWQAEEGKTEWALGSTNVQFLSNSSTPSQTKNHIRKVDFDWSWGYRAGLGYNMVHDKWDTQLYYTWFYTKKSDAFSQRGSSTNSPFGNTHNNQILSLLTINPKNNGTFSSGKINWAIHFNTGDWELGRNYNVSQHLALRPYLGLKGGIIDQNIRGSFVEAQSTTPFDTVTFHYKNHFWGLGPKGGASGRWNLVKTSQSLCSLYGNVAGSILYGHFHVRENNQETGPGLSAGNDFGTQTVNNLNRTLATPVFQVGLGFVWDIKCNKDRCHVGINLGYELQYWFKQNQLMSLADQIPQRLDADLSLQGGTLGLRLDF